MAAHPAGLTTLSCPAALGRHDACRNWSGHGGHHPSADTIDDVLAAALADHEAILLRHMLQSLTTRATTATLSRTRSTGPRSLLADNPDVLIVLAGTSMCSDQRVGGRTLRIRPLI